MCINTRKAIYMTTQNETEKHVSVVYNQTVPNTVFEDEIRNENLEANSKDAIIEVALDSIYKKFLTNKPLPDGVVATVHEGVRFDPDTEMGTLDPNEFTVVFSFDPELQNTGGAFE